MSDNLRQFPNVPTIDGAAKVDVLTADSMAFAAIRCRCVPEAPAIPIRLGKSSTCPACGQRYVIKAFRFAFPPREGEEALALIVGALDAPIVSPH